MLYVQHTENCNLINTDTLIQIIEVPLQDPFVVPS